MELPENTILDPFDLLCCVQGHAAGGKIFVGERGDCRFCGERDPRKFRRVAHTFPEALGNKWVISLDECDDCNDLFSRYESALAASVGTILTLGGTKGKGNKVRQTGRTATGPRVRHSRRERRGISIVGSLPDPRSAFQLDVENKRLRAEIGLPDEKFIPRHAYKALVKMALALLPRDDLNHYSKLLSWLRDPSDLEEFHLLPVGLSFGSIGNAPPSAIGALLRRRKRDDPLPFTVFLFCAGSVCLQIDLMSDTLEDHLPPTPIDTLKVAWTTIIGDGLGNEIKIPYGDPFHQNWAPRELTVQPIQSVAIDLCMLSNRANFTIRMREITPA